MEKRDKNLWSWWKSSGGTGKAITRRQTHRLSSKDSRARILIIIIITRALGGYLIFFLVIGLIGDDP